MHNSAQQEPRAPPGRADRPGFNDLLDPILLFDILYISLNEVASGILDTVKLQT